MILMKCHCIRTTIREGKVENRVRTSIVHHILGRRRELGVAFDNLLHRVEHILLGHHLAPSADGKHAGLCAHASNFCTCRVGTKSGKQLPTHAFCYVQGRGVNLENFGSTLSP